MVSVTTLARGKLAFTVPQPWAQLSVMGLRTVERRSWPFPRRSMGKPVIVHASASVITETPVRRAIERVVAAIDSGIVGPGTILGEVHPVRYARIREVLVRALEDPASFPLGAGIGTVVVIESRDSPTECGVPASRRYEWVLDRHQAVEWLTPRPAVGRHGLWQWGYVT